MINVEDHAAGGKGNNNNDKKTPAKVLKQHIELLGKPYPFFTEITSSAPRLKSWKTKFGTSSAPRLKSWKTKFGRIVFHAHHTKTNVALTFFNFSKNVFSVRLGKKVGRWLKCGMRYEGT